MRTSRRVVIVYERAGQGHLAAAEVLRSILEGEPGVEVVLKDGAELEGDGGENFLVALWNWLIKRGWFRLADLILNHWFRVAIFPLLSVSAALPRVKSRLKAMHPDAVISTADAFNRALGDAAIEIAVPFTVLPIEFSIFADMMHPDAEYLVYFEETARAIQRFDLSTPHFRTVIRDQATAREKLAYLIQWFAAYDMRRTEPLLFQGAGGLAPQVNSLTCHVLGPLRETADHAPAAEAAPNEQPQILVERFPWGAVRFARGTKAVGDAGPERPCDRALRPRPVIDSRASTAKARFGSHAPRMLWIRRRYAGTATSRERIGGKTLRQPVS